MNKLPQVRICIVCNQEDIEESRTDGGEQFFTVNKRCHDGRVLSCKLPIDDSGVMIDEYKNPDPELGDLESWSVNGWASTLSFDVYDDLTGLSPSKVI